MRVEDSWKKIRKRVYFIIRIHISKLHICEFRSLCV